MRPRPGSHSPAEVPKTLAIPREAGAAPARPEEARPAKESPSSRAAQSGSEDADPFLDSAFAFADEDAKEDDDVIEEQQPGGVEKSRGFSKWFGFSRKSTGASGTSADGIQSTGEIGVLTDTGTCTGVDESSTEEEAELQLADGLAAAGAKEPTAASSPELSSSEDVPI
mmetsp:Transcript_71829/g.210944  ORF Transcript_71829/g.210944 Transcript_71829/m.210944 type:complete len:169 (-) Transcript_71829:93-599(-)